jgi:hypothetical protein
MGVFDLENVLEKTFIFAVGFRFFILIAIIFV